MGSIDEFLKQDIAFGSDFVVSAAGDFEMISGLSNVRQALFRRLLTSPGTMAHRPTYGVGIKDFQNSQNTLPTRRTLALRIKEQFELDERVELVEGVSFSTEDDNPSKVTINVRVKIVGYGETTFEFRPFGDTPT